MFRKNRFSHRRFDLIHFMAHFKPRPPGLSIAAGFYQPLS